MKGGKVTMEKEREIRRLVEQIPAEVLQQDLEKFRKRALELGATDAAIIRASDVIIDERARAPRVNQNRNTGASRRLKWPELP